MGVIMYSSVWQFSHSKGAGLTLMLALAEHGNELGICWPGVATLADLCRVKSPPNIRRATKKLVDAGEIYVFPGGRGPRSTNVYFIAISFCRDEIVAILNDARHPFYRDTPLYKFSGAPDSTPESIADEIVQARGFDTPDQVFVWGKFKRGAKSNPLENEGGRGAIVDPLDDEEIKGRDIARKGVQYRAEGVRSRAERDALSRGKGRDIKPRSVINPHSDPANNPSDQPPPQNGGGDGLFGWPVEQMINGGKKPKTKDEKLNWLAWVLYGWANHSRVIGEGKGINNPELLASSRMQSPPADYVFSTLANIGPKQLERWMQHPHTPDVPAYARSIVINMAQAGFEETVNKINQL